MAPRPLDIFLGLLSGRAERARRLLESAIGHYEAGQPQLALQAAQDALSLSPRLAEAHNMAGVALLAVGRAEEAIVHLRAALREKPRYAAAHVNLGNALVQQGLLDLAIGEYEGAVSADPQDSRARLNLAMALEDDGRHAEARTAYEAALSLAPDDGVRIKLATMLPDFPASNGEIDLLRARLDRDLSALLEQPLALLDPLRQVGQTAFLLPYQGRNDRDLQRKLARLYQHACPALAYTAAHCDRPRRPGPLRVGFASKHLTAHSVGVWFNRLVALLAADPDLEVTLVDLGGNADAELRGACQRYLVPPGHLFAARESIAALELDALLYPDIGMEPFGYFLAFSRLAPLQAAMLGHPVTTGVPTIDHFVSSALFEPADADGHYSEKLERLSALPLYFERPLLPEPTKTRVQLGLPEDRRLYACPMMLHKFHPDFDAAMAKILRQDARGEIILFQDPGRTRRHARLHERFAASYPDVARRVRFLPWASFEDLIAIIRCADVILDTFHFSAGTTAFLVFAAGRPIVTLPGAYVRGRPTLGCYRRMGILECVASDADDYVRLALRIAGEPDLRVSLGRRISQESEALFGDRGAVREMAAYLRRATASG